VAAAGTRRRWTIEEIGRLRQFAADGISAPQAAHELGRSTGAVQQKAIELGLALTRVEKTDWWPGSAGRRALARAEHDGG
jgi:hypothetical protein